MIRYVNVKTVVVSVVAISAILAGAPRSFARPQYLTNLSAVYGDGSCTTCHVMSQNGGPRGSNFGSHTPDGTYEPRNFNRTNESRGSNRTFESRNSSRTLPRNSYGTLFENQPGHVTDPGAALIAIGPPPATTPADTTVTSTGIPTAPGFGIAASMAGLFSWVLLFRRRNK